MARRLSVERMCVRCSAAIMDNTVIAAFRFSTYSIFPPLAGTLLRLVRTKYQTIATQQTQTMMGSREAYKGDPLETVFSAMEVTCCPGSYKPEPTPDSLDYVFENVGESSASIWLSKLSWSPPSSRIVCCVLC